ncbi:MAG: hypothetical protein WBA68_06995 [Alteraurantiacibacter sp.]
MSGQFNWVPKADQFPKKNALTPIGALSLGLFAAAVVGAVILGNQPLSYIFMAMAAAPLLATIWGFVFFVKNDADRLQTEDYRIQREIVAKVTHITGVGEGHIPPPDAPAIPPFEDLTNE